MQNLFFLLRQMSCFSENKDNLSLIVDLNKLTDALCSARIIYFYIKIILD
jgi:hypothetical protein